LKIRIRELTLTVNMWIEKLTASTAAPQERCGNPWNPECTNEDIELYILIRGRKLPICRSCWNEIADKNLEW